MKIIKDVLRSKRTFYATIVLAIVLVITPLMTYAYYAEDISDKERLMNRKSTGVILRDKNGEIIYRTGKINGNELVKLDQISDHLENAVIASEDDEFYQHQGYSIRGTVRALYANTISKDPYRYGGSTITQQLVKNKLLTAEKNYFRKYQEVSMATAVERRYSKQEILEMYLNSVYFGEGAFGIHDAAKVYFDKSPQDLTLTESTMLVALLPAPSTLSPISGDKEKAKEYQERVLTKMVENRFIAQEEKQAALNQELVFAQSTRQNFDTAQHYILMVLDELKAKYGEERVTRSGFDVTTTLDLNWQKNAEQKVREKIASIHKYGARNSGLVAIDPKTGEVRALVGSIDWHNQAFGKVNMATSARQPGSSFKPIYYTEALDKGLITPATILEDKPKTYGNNYRPVNYDFRHRGDISVRNALAQSLNIPSVDVMQMLGPEAASAAAQRMGVSTVTEPQKYGLSLGLGTAEVKLLELSHAYSALANQGHQAPLKTVVSIKNKYGEDVLKPTKISHKKVVSPEASFLISSILSDNEARRPTFGSNLTVPNREVAVKTGTTNDSKDAWTVGYTPSVTVGVWVGNNENEPMVGLAGSSSAGAIWRETIKDYLANSPQEKFEPTSNIVRLNVCTGSGQRAISNGYNTYEEFFIKGNEPKGTCNEPRPQKQENEEEKKPEEEEKKEEKKKPEENQPNRNTPQEEQEGGRGSGEQPQPEPVTPPAEDEEEESTGESPSPSPTNTTSPT